MKLGDAFSAAATPIARVLHLPCVDPSTGQLRPESGCNKSRLFLNDFSDSIYDRFWPSKNKQPERESMQFLVNEVTTLTYSVEAETSAEAIKKVEKGEGMELPNSSVNRTAMVRAVPQQAVAQVPRGQS